jgi:MoaA/NifB/PqqE/SkfB family radical SAM enzyme
MENIYLRESPSKIYIEVTTRCNLNCSMCVKQAEGCGIRDGDFDLNL